MGKRLVKSCPKLEAGLRLGQEGIHACQLGQFSSPIYWTADEAAGLAISREMITEKRKWLFELLNDETSDIPCKTCRMVCEKPADEVDFTRLGHIDLAATTLCNLRCTFCGYTQADNFQPSKFNALSVLENYSPEDVLWNSAVDFNGGEPTLLKDFEAHLAFFQSRRIRVFLYTNAVRYSSAVSEGLRNGTLGWVCTSLDAGTPSTFLRTKGRNHFQDVVENVSRYASAARHGTGNVALKYIFTEENCGEDDLIGFVNAAVAIRPQAIWLTFDFLPIENLPGDTPDFGGYDYGMHVKAYVQVYHLLKRYGLNVVHFAEKHLGMVGEQGRALLTMVRAEIARTDPDRPPLPDLFQCGLEHPETSLPPHAVLQAGPLSVVGEDGGLRPQTFAGKRILLAPLGALSLELLGDPALREATLLGLLDRDPVLQGKVVRGLQVHSYQALQTLKPDAVLVASPEQHREAILRTVHTLMAPDSPPALYVLR